MVNQIIIDIKVLYKLWDGPKLIDTCPWGQQGRGKNWFSVGRLNKGGGW